MCWAPMEYAQTRLRLKPSWTCHTPTDVAGARRVLGVINFLAQFLPALSEVVKPIQDLTHKDAA